MFITNVIFLVNIFFCFYIIYSRGDDMNTAIIVALIGVIGSIIGAICTLIKGNRQDKASFDFISKELSEKHTSEKAYSYYINTKNDISKITKEVIEARKDIDKNHYDMKERIDKTWTNVNNSSTELKVLSNNLNSYLNSINNAKSDDTNLINALNTVQNFVYETGKKI